MPQVQGKCDSKFMYVSLPALPVILGVVLLVWQGQADFINVLAGLFLAFCGVGVGLFLWNRHAHELAMTNSLWEQDQDDKFDAVVTYTTELERLLLAITPILSQHVMASREHTEQEIVSLTNRFASMVNELQQIVESTDNALSGQSYHLDSVLSTARNLLQPIPESLRQIYQFDHNLQSELQKLAGHLEELSAFVNESENVSGQIKIFAAKVSNDAVLGDEARRLIESAEAIDRALGSKVNEIGVATEAAMSLSKQSVEHDDSSLILAESNIDQILSHLTLALTHYRNDVEALRNNADQIRVEINNVLVALQFQDRVSQILTQVENNLLNLQSTIEKIQQQGPNRNGNMLQVDQAVEHIEESYKSVSAHTTTGSDSSDDLTFF